MPPLKFSAKHKAIARVAVHTPTRQVFDYWIGEHPAQRLQPGSRVRVPFGTTSRVGIVVELADDTRIEPQRLRLISETLDSTPTLSAELLKLLLWSSDYYHHPVGEVLFSALPLWLRKGRTIPEHSTKSWKLTTTGQRADLTLLRRAPKQAMLYRRFQTQPGIEETSLATLGGNWRSTLEALRKRGWIERTSALNLSPPASNASLITPLTLNAAQSSTLIELKQALGKFQVHVLEGITGSGKTEVYLRLIKTVIEQNNQALLLVPEISLTPQTLKRIRDALPNAVGALHSNLSPRQRMEAWLNARQGTLPILVGTRSAVFTPFCNLGIIIIDEEHDLCYKQQDGFRYSARDLAIRRAQQLNIPVILGSATPSLETLQHVQNARYTHFHLPSRAGGAAPPTVHVIDMRRARAAADRLSPQLLSAIGANFARGEQSLLFVNQRGYAPVLMCHHCAWVAQCQRCDARLVWHRTTHRLQCHHCLSEQDKPALCPVCNTEAIIAIGIGTERLVESIEKHFPDMQIARIDRDSMRRRGALEDAIEAVQKNEVHLLVGTQMLTKGHHFPNLTLVGIVDVDHGLFGADFRAPERMGQLIIQVAGRAGRGSRKGAVYLQTYHPRHPTLHHLIKHGYGHFARHALAERQKAAFPPFSALALLRAEASKKETNLCFLKQAQELAEAHHGKNVTVLGPIPALMERRNGRFRALLLLQGEDRPSLQQLLTSWVREVETLPMARRVRWSIDVDPQEMS